MNSDELKAKLAEQRARRVAHAAPVGMTRRARRLSTFTTVMGLGAALIFSALTAYYLWAFEHYSSSPAEDVSALLIAVSTNTLAPATFSASSPAPSPTPYTLRVCAGLPEARLHVRFTPGGEVRGYLVESEVVLVRTQDEGWIEIESPIAGWVDATYLCE
jgi:hypothetical protein